MPLVATSPACFRQPPRESAAAPLAQREDDSDNAAHSIIAREGSYIAHAVDRGLDAQVGTVACGASHVLDAECELRKIL